MRAHRQKALIALGRRLGRELMLAFLYFALGTPAGRSVRQGNPVKLAPICKIETENADKQRTTLAQAPPW
jgi:hypothetical protein